MHAVARLVLHPLVPNVQASWVKLGRAGALLALAAGANDLGGVLMNESITRAAGGVNGQEMDADVDAGGDSLDRSRAARSGRRSTASIDSAMRPTAVRFSSASSGGGASAS